MRKKKLFLMFISMSLLIFVITACGNDESDVTDIAQYNVIIEVIDNESETALADVILEIEDANGKKQTAESTDKEGIYKFSDINLEKNEVFTVKINKSGYESKSISLVADSNTVEVTGSDSVVLKESQDEAELYTVSFNVKNENEKVIEDAEITFNEKNKMTDKNGEVTFKDIETGNYSYSIKKKNYITIEDEIKVTKNVNEEVILKEVDADVTGEGTEDNPYIIYTFTGLEKIMEEDKYELDAYYELGNDIDASQTRERTYNDGKGWQPIGDFNNSFTGYFDGKDYTINDLYIDRPEESFIGLFASVKKGKISNMNLTNIEIVGKNNVGGITGYSSGKISNVHVTGEVNNTYETGKIGGLIGENNNGVILDCQSEVEVLGTGSYIGGLIGLSTGDDYKVENCSATGDVYGLNSDGDRVGGLIGSSSGIRSIVKDSHATGSVEGKDFNIGGLIGENEETYINNSYATGNVKGDNSTGGLIGLNRSGDIEKVYAEGEVNGYQHVGGLIGFNSTDEVLESYAVGKVTAEGNDSGGLIGYNKADIIDCYAEGDVESTGSNYTGGLVGEHEGNIKNSYAIGNIKGIENVGGLVGSSSGSYNSIVGCHATGNVQGKSGNIGGLIGLNEETYINDCYAKGDVEGDNSTGGLIGLNRSGDIEKVYAEGEVNGYQHVGGLIGFNSTDEVLESYAVGKVTAEGNDSGGLIGYNKADIIDCYAEGDVESTGTNHTGGLVGEHEGNIEKSYAIGNVWGKEGVGGLAGSAVGSYKKIVDSYATGNVVANSDNIGGLIGLNEIDVTGSYAEGDVNGDKNDSINVGGLIGDNNGGKVSDSQAEGNVIGKQDVGGLIGENNGNMELSFAEGQVKISGNNAGGLVGSNSDGVIKQCYAVGDVSGSDSIGGLIGRTWSYSKVKNCFATGNVEGESRIGGLVAWNHIGDSAIVENSFSIGFVSGTEYTGGLVGDNEDEVSYSYYDQDSSGQNDTGKGIAKTTEEMLQQATFDNWDFTDIWEIEEGSTYPHLQWQDNNIPVPANN